MPTITWTGFSPTLGAGNATVPATTGTLIDGAAAIEKKVSQLLRKPSYRAQRRLLRVLNGNNVGAGGNAVENRTRVQARVVLSNESQGGLIPIETVPLVGATTAGRVTATADQTQLNAMIDEIVYPSSYPTDASGNGGGGKNGF